MKAAPRLLRRTCLASVLLHAFCLYFMILPAATYAQPNPPSPPYVKSPAPGSSWSITIKQVPKKPKAGEPGAASAATNSTGDKAAGSPAPTPAPTLLPGVTPVRSDYEYGLNKVRREVTQYSDNHREESFTIKGQTMRHYDGSDKIAVLQAVPLFPALEWLAGGSVYVGTEMIGTKECYKFRISPEYLQSANWPADSQYFAWISVAEGFPAQIQADETLYTFSEVTRFAKDVSLPDDYKVAIEQASRSQRALEMMRKQSVR